MMTKAERLELTDDVETFLVWCPPETEDDAEKVLDIIGMYAAKEWAEKNDARLGFPMAKGGRRHIMVKSIWGGITGYDITGNMYTGKLEYIVTSVFEYEKERPWI